MRENVMVPLGTTGVGKGDKLATKVTLVLSGDGLVGEGVTAAVEASAVTVCVTVLDIPEL